MNASKQMMIRAAVLAISVFSAALIWFGTQNVADAASAWQGCFYDWQCPRDGELLGTCACISCPSCAGVCQSAGFDNCGGLECDPWTEDCDGDGCIDNSGSCGNTNPDFSVAVSPAYTSVQQGQTAAYTLTITSSDGFDGTVNLSLPVSGGCPAGASCSIMPASFNVPPNGSMSALLQVVPTTGTAVQSHTINVIGSNSSRGNRSATMTLGVTAVPPAPSCSSTAPQSATTYDTSGAFYVYAYGVANAVSVSFPTWGETGGQDDLSWYTGTNLGGGTWRAAVDLSNHKFGNPEFGTFFTNIYFFNSAYPGGVVNPCGGFTFQRPQFPPPSNVSASCAEPGTTVTVNWTQVPGFPYYYAHIYDETANAPATESTVIAGSSYSWAGATPGHVYSYWVFTTSSTGNPRSSETPASRTTTIGCALPPPLPTNGRCEPADAATYPNTATSYTLGTFCSAGNIVGGTPPFPPVGGSSSWQCAGLNGGTTASCTAFRNEPAPDPSFTLSVQPSLLLIKRSALPGTLDYSKTATVTVGPLNNFDANVVLTASTPIGTAIFKPSTVISSNYQSNFVLAVPGTTPVGTYSVVVTGTGGGITTQATITIDISDGTGGQL